MYIFIVYFQYYKINSIYIGLLWFSKKLIFQKFTRNLSRQIRGEASFYTKIYAYKGEGIARNQRCERIAMLLQSSESSIRTPRPCIAPLLWRSVKVWDREKCFSPRLSREIEFQFRGILKRKVYYIHIHVRIYQSRSLHRNSSRWDEGSEHLVAITIKVTWLDGNI